MFFCGDIRIYDDDQQLIYDGPAFVRCEEYGCRKMVTNGYLENHGACSCGGRKFKNALMLTPDEIQGLRNGDYELNEWEQFFIAQELEREREEATDRHTRI
jgi:hypothetical protein